MICSIENFAVTQTRSIKVIPAHTDN